MIIPQPGPITAARQKKLCPTAFASRQGGFCYSGGVLLLKDRQGGQPRAIENRPPAGRGRKAGLRRAIERAELWKRRTARMGIAKANLELGEMPHEHSPQLGPIDVVKMCRRSLHRSPWQFCHRRSKCGSTAQAAPLREDAMMSARGSWRSHYRRRRFVRYPF